MLTDLNVNSSLENVNFTHLITKHTHSRKEAIERKQIEYHQQQTTEAEYLKYSKGVIALKKTFSIKMNLSFVLTFFLGQLLLAAPFAPSSGLGILNSRVTNRENTEAPRITQIMAVGDNYSDDMEKAILNNLQRTCIKQFLSQRAFQSFMFLLADLRDVHTSDWLERFLDTPNLLQFHGTGAFNMTRFETWDSYFLELQKCPKDKIIVQARRSQAHGRRLFNSGSKNNPYLQKDFLTEIEIDIDPPSLVPRIIAVREQIGKELSIDVDLIRIHSDQSKHIVVCFF